MEIATNVRRTVLNNGLMTEKNGHFFSAGSATGTGSGAAKFLVSDQTLIDSESGTTGAREVPLKSPAEQAASGKPTL